MKTNRKKLKLDLNDLKVESFDTTPDMSKVSKGTVFGYYVTEVQNCSDDTCVLSCGDVGCGSVIYNCGTAFMLLS